MKIIDKLMILVISLVVFVILMGLTFYIINLKDMKNYCNSKEGLFSGEDTCLIKEGDNYVEYKIVNTDKGMVLVR